jgi:putative DNA primase/helicase
MARCPAHPDRSASLSISKGRDGRVLVNCFAGCAVTAVLKASGLRLRDLFAGPPPSAAQAQFMAAQREEQERRQQKQRVVERVAFDRIRRLHAIADELVMRLVRIPDGDSTGDPIVRLYHKTLDQLRRAEAEVQP